MTLAETRTQLLAETALRGTAFCSALTHRVDVWLQELYAAQVGDRADIALVAVGGYGRGELCPNSDLDVLLLHRSVADIAEVAQRLWYPIWDEGEKLGHAVRTPSEALDLAGDDVDTGTAMLSLRHLAGDRTLTDAVATESLALWQAQSRSWLFQLADAAEERRRQSGDLAFLLEPDIKSARGGLRDVHALMWGQAADPDITAASELQDEYEVLLEARVELHRITGRANDKLLLEEQDAVAAALGYDDADVLMAAIASSARRIAWLSDRTWTAVRDRLNSRKSRFRRSKVLVVGPGVTVVDGKVKLDPETAVSAESVLRVAVGAAAHNAIIDNDTLDRFDASSLPSGQPWTDETRELFVELLAVGHPAISHIETIDQLGLFVPLIPEWEPNRSRPQRNVYHRFTVDRHLWEAAAEAAELTDTVSRPDLLLVGALLHDVGKGYPGDHTDVGMELVEVIAQRMGFAPADVETLVAMVEHHLLLPDAATRRDVHDPDTLAVIARETKTVERLELLAALTVADSIATGPAAWSTWKASLVAELTLSAAHYMAGGDLDDLQQGFPTAEHLERMRAGSLGVHGEGDTLTVFAGDRPGVFYRVSGALSLNGLDVQDAAAHSDHGVAHSQFRVSSEFPGEIGWPKVVKMVEQALDGRLAIDARLAQRQATYQRQQARMVAQRIVETKVTFDNETSSTATVIEVSAKNAMGVLYRITRIMAALDLSILKAKVQTLSDDVVDSFYVQDRLGGKVTDPAHISEIELAILHAIGDESHGA